MYIQRQNPVVPLIRVYQHVNRGSHLSIMHPIIERMLNVYGLIYKAIRDDKSFSSDATGILLGLYYAAETMQLEELPQAEKIAEAGMNFSAKKLGAVLGVLPSPKKLRKKVFPNDPDLQKRAVQVMNEASE